MNNVIHINLYIFPIILILGMIFSTRDVPKNRRNYIIIVTLLLMLECAFRGLSVGSDTSNYYNMFFHTSKMSWSEIWDSFVGRYIYGTDENDVGYTVMVKLISLITSSWSAFVFIAQLTFFVPLGVLLYRHANRMIELVFAFILYVSLFHIIALSGGRQLYAMGLCIAALLLYERDKMKYAVGCMLIAITIHMSALLFFIPYLLNRFNGGFVKKFHLVSFGLVPFILLETNSIIIFMGNMVGSEKYAAYGMREVAGGTWTFISLLLFISMFCYLSIPKHILDDRQDVKQLYVMAPLFTIFGPLIHSNGTMIRISMYFHIFLLLLIPMAINYGYKKNANMYYLMIAVLLFLSLRGGGFEYKFIWDDHIPAY